MNTNTLLIIIEGTALVITILTIIGRSSYRNGEQRKEYEAMEKRMDEAEKGLAAMGGKVSASSTTTGKMQTDIDWIKDALKEIKRALRLSEEEK